jgi:flavin reductase (DIM6/NTAB) family NADH-FMN oxidoreductase RutF
MKQFYDIKNDRTADFNYRFIQPPQIAYFVTTLDEFGNVNATPVTLGTCNGATPPDGGQAGEYYLTFSMGTKSQSEPGNANHPRDGYINLMANDEAVVSYVGKDLIEETVIANLPLPRGISELDVAGLHTFPSTNIDVPSIRECPINIECTITDRIPLGNHYMLFVAKAVGISVDDDLIREDDDGYGVLHIDPAFELDINRDRSKNNRLHFGFIDKNDVRIPGDDFGSFIDWVGSFDHFIDSEFRRGKITEEEVSEIHRLAHEFKRERGNADIKRRLTVLLKKAIKGKTT